MTPGTSQLSEITGAGSIAKVKHLLLPRAAPQLLAVRWSCSRTTTPNSDGNLSPTEPVKSAAFRVHQSSPSYNVGLLDPVSKVMPVPVTAALLRNHCTISHLSCSSLVLPTTEIPYPGGVPMGGILSWPKRRYVPVSLKSPFDLLQGVKPGPTNAKKITDFRIDKLKWDG